jgi:hypothetical protein
LETKRAIVIDGSRDHANIDAREDILLWLFHRANLKGACAISQQARINGSCHASDMLSEWIEGLGGEPVQVMDESERRSSAQAILAKQVERADDDVYLFASGLDFLESEDTEWLLECFDHLFEHCNRLRLVWTTDSKHDRVQNWSETGPFSIRIGAPNPVEVATHVRRIADDPLATQIANANFDYAGLRRLLVDGDA